MLNLGTTWRCVINCTSRPPYLPPCRKKYRSSMNRRLGGPQGWSRHIGEVKNLFVPTDIRTKNHPGDSLRTVETTLHFYNAFLIYFLPLAAQIVTPAIYLSTIGLSFAVQSLPACVLTKSSTLAKTSRCSLTKTRDRKYALL